MKHELKMEPRFFKVAWAGKKPFEIRNNDRKFEINDEIVLQEWEPECGATGVIEDGYTDREIHGFIEYITDYGLQPGFVAFSYTEVGRRDN